MAALKNSGYRGSAPYAQAFFMLDVESRLLCYGPSVKDQRTMYG